MYCENCGSKLKLQEGGDAYEFDVSQNIAGNPVKSYNQCSSVGGDALLEQTPVPLQQESVVPQSQNGGDAYTFDHILQPKIGNLPEVSE